MRERPTKINRGIIRGTAERENIESDRKTKEKKDTK